MKSLLPIAIVLFLFSCGKNSNSERNDLLTSLSWTIERASLDGRPTNAVETHRFVDDGTYTLESGEVKVNGNWEWTEADVIHLHLESLTINGETNTYDVQPAYYIKIVELTEKTLRTLEKGEGDSWDSGFAKERTYAASGN